LKTSTRTSCVRTSWTPNSVLVENGFGRAACTVEAVIGPGSIVVSSGFIVTFTPPASTSGP
jgi:hypothetical protein